MPDRMKKLLMTIAALGALAAGGSALANAAQGGSSTPTATPTQSETVDTPEPGDKPDANEQGEHQDGNEASDQVTGADAKKAADAALATTGGGKVNEVSAETQDDNGDAAEADTPEPGDTADPAYESKIAYDVEVTKTDGTVVDVHLDKAFSVLGTTNADAEDGH